MWVLVRTPITWSCFHYNKPIIPTSHDIISGAWLFFVTHEPAHSLMQLYIFTFDISIFLFSDDTELFYHIYFIYLPSYTPNYWSSLHFVFWLRIMRYVLYENNSLSLLFLLLHSTKFSFWTKHRQEMLDLTTLGVWCINDIGCKRSCLIAKPHNPTVHV